MGGEGKEPPLDGIVENLLSLFKKDKDFARVSSKLRSASGDSDEAKAALIVSLNFLFTHKDLAGPIATKKQGNLLSILAGFNRLVKAGFFGGDDFAYVVSTKTQTTFIETASGAAEALAASIQKMLEKRVKGRTIALIAAVVKTTELLAKANPEKDQCLGLFTAVLEIYLGLYRNIKLRGSQRALEEVHRRTNESINSIVIHYRHSSEMVRSLAKVSTKFALSGVSNEVLNDLRLQYLAFSETLGEDHFSVMDEYRISKEFAAYQRTKKWTAMTLSIERLNIGTSTFYNCFKILQKYTVSEKYEGAPLQPFIRDVAVPFISEYFKLDPVLSLVISKKMSSTIFLLLDCPQSLSGADLEFLMENIVLKVLSPRNSIGVAKYDYGYDFKSKILDAVGNSKFFGSYVNKPKTPEWGFIQRVLDAIVLDLDYLGERAAHVLSVPLIPDSAIYQFESSLDTILRRNLQVKGKKDVIQRLQQNHFVDEYLSLTISIFSRVMLAGKSHGEISYFSLAYSDLKGEERQAVFSEFLETYGIKSQFQQFSLDSASTERLKELTNRPDVDVARLNPREFTYILRFTNKRDFGLVPLIHRWLEHKAVKVKDSPEYLVKEWFGGTVFDVSEMDFDLFNLLLCVYVERVSGGSDMGEKLKSVISKAFYTYRHAVGKDDSNPLRRKAIDALTGHLKLYMFFNWFTNKDASIVEKVTSGLLLNLRESDLHAFEFLRSVYQNLKLFMLREAKTVKSEQKISSSRALRRVSRRFVYSQSFERYALEYLFQLLDRKSFMDLEETEMTFWGLFVEIVLLLYGFKVFEYSSQKDEPGRFNLRKYDLVFEQPPLLNTYSFSRLSSGFLYVIREKFEEEKSHSFENIQNITKLFVERIDKLLFVNWNVRSFYSLFVQVESALKVFEIVLTSKTPLSLDFIVDQILASVKEIFTLVSSDAMFRYLQVTRKVLSIFDHATASVIDRVETPEDMVSVEKAFLRMREIVEREKENLEISEILDIFKIVDSGLERVSMKAKQLKIELSDSLLTEACLIMQILAGLPLIAGASVEEISEISKIMFDAFRASSIPETQGRILEISYKFVHSVCCRCQGDEQVAVSEDSSESELEPLDSLAQVFKLIDESSEWNIVRDVEALNAEFQEVQRAFRQVMAESGTARISKRQFDIVLGPYLSGLLDITFSAHTVWLQSMKHFWDLFDECMFKMGVENLGTLFGLIESSAFPSGGAAPLIEPLRAFFVRYYSCTFTSMMNDEEYSQDNAYVNRFLESSYRIGDRLLNWNCVASTQLGEIFYGWLKESVPPPVFLSAANLSRLERVLRSTIGSLEFLSRAYDDSGEGEWLKSTAVRFGSVYGKGILLDKLLTLATARIVKSGVPVDSSVVDTFVELLENFQAESSAFNRDAPRRESLYEHMSPRPNVYPNFFVFEYVTEQNVLRLFIYRKDKTSKVFKRIQAFITERYLQHTVAVDEQKGSVFARSEAEQKETMERVIRWIIRYVWRHVEKSDIKQNLDIIYNLLLDVSMRGNRETRDQVSAFFSYLLGD